MPVQEVDRHLRRRALLWLAALCLPTLLLLDRFPPILQSLADSPESLANHLGLICLFLYVLVLPMLLLCFWLWRFARSVIAGERFPPAGSKVIRDTLVLEGKAALTRGRIIKVLAAILFVLFALFPLVFVYVLNSFL